MAIDWFGVGCVSAALNDTEAATRAYENALSADPELHDAKNNLAMLLRVKGDYDAAEPLFREALAMRRRVLGDDHPHVAGSLSNLAFLLSSKGDNDGAEPLCREALAMRRRLLGDEHPDVATALNNLGSLLSDKGDYDGAEPLRGWYRGKNVQDHLIFSRRWTLDA